MREKKFQMYVVVSKYCDCKEQGAGDHERSNGEEQNADDEGKAVLIPGRWAIRALHHRV